jgi:DNA-binding LytR/AlgR family response regulator
MITCLIVDDEQSATNVLKSYVEKIPFLELGAIANDPLEALKILHDKKIDLMFVDVQMPNLSGVELVKMIQGKKTKIVFTTAYAEFAVEGFEHEALDYLLKPISFERFLKAAQRALDVSAFSPSEWQPAAKEDGYIFVKTELKGKMLKVNFKDIMYIEGLKNYVSIYTPEERIISYISFKQLEEILPSNFMRVHKSYIVSMDKIKAVDGNQILLHTMKAYIPLGETYRAPFFDMLQQKIMGGKK